MTIATISGDAGLWARSGVGVFCLYDRCFILLPTYRTHKGFLHVMDPYHFCRSDTQFFPDKLIPQVFHRGTTVRTDPFFRGKHRRRSLLWEGPHTDLHERTFFFWSVYVLLQRSPFLPPGSLPPDQDAWSFRWMFQRSSFSVHLSSSFRFAIVLRSSFMVALRSTMVCSCSLFVLNKSWIISSVS